MSCGLVTARPAKTVMTELAQQTLKAQSLTCKQACSYLIEKDGTGHVAHLLILVPAPRQQRQDTGVYSSFTSCNDEIKPLCLTLNALGPWDEVARLPVAEVNVVPQDGNIQQLPHILALVVPCYAMAHDVKQVSARMHTPGQAKLAGLSGTRTCQVLVTIAKLLAYLGKLLQYTLLFLLLVLTCTYLLYEILHHSGGSQAQELRQHPQIGSRSRRHSPQRVLRTCKPRMNATFTMAAVLQRKASAANRGVSCAVTGLPGQ